MGVQVDVVMRGTAAGMQIVNTFAYEDSSSVVTPLTAGEVNGLLGAFATVVADKLTACLATTYASIEYIGQGRTEGGARDPFLPEILPRVVAGNQGAAIGPPMYVAILGMRVSPRVTPLGRPPVRKGYIAVSPLPEIAYDADGTIAVAYRNGVDVTALEAAVALPIINTVNGVTRTWIPIRVGQPDGPDGPRARGTVLSAVMRTEASARRSRKLGVGA